MSGLNPDGLGRTAAFSNSESDSLSTGNAAIGETPRHQYVSNEHKTVTVDHTGGADYESIQAAVDDAPKRLRHEYIIDVADGHNESIGGSGHVKIQGHSQEGLSTGDRGIGTAGENYQIQIEGDRSDPPSVEVDSLTVVGCVGVETPQVYGIEFQGASNPDFDENCCVGVAGSTEVFFGSCQLTDTANADTWILAYGSNIHVRNSYGGNGAVDILFLVKRMAQMYVRGTTGNPNNFRYRLQGMARTQEGEGSPGKLSQYDVDFFGSQAGVHWHTNQGFITKDTGVISTGDSTQIRDNRGAHPYEFTDTVNGVDRFEVGANSGMTVESQDLSALTLTSDENGRIYRHNGANTINADGGTTTNEGYYAWDNSADEFKSVVQF